MAKASVIGFVGILVGGVLFAERSRALVFHHWILSSVVALLIFYLLSNSDEWRSGLFSVLNHEDARTHVADVKNQVDTYNAMYGTDSRASGSQHSALLNTRLTLYTEMVNKFYNLVTDFYEYGWGESFHFAPRAPCETFHESQRRHEYHIASRLQLRPGVKCADLGCGIGGPMRAIARFSGATIVGINNNDYQITVGTKYLKRDGVDHLCTLAKCDFMKLPFKDGEFDCVYEIEATCHAPDKLKCYSEVARMLRAGGLFAGYEWVMTSKYDPSNKQHVNIKNGIEIGNGLPDIATIPHVRDSLEKAGFEIVEAYEMSTGASFHKTQIPWYNPLEGSFSLSGFRRLWLGRQLTHLFVTILELLRIAPAGSVKVSKLLNETANDLVKAGQLDIFSPSYYFLARKTNADAKTATA